MASIEVCVYCSLKITEPLTLARYDSSSQIA
jgi:hypothetical protein